MEPFDKVEEEFIKAYDELADPLFRHCFFRVSGREKAKDFVQETFVKTWEYIASGKEITNLRAFLYKVANNLIIDYYRKNKDVSLDNLMEKGFDAHSSGKKEIESEAEHSIVIRSLKELEPKQKEVIIMRFLDGLSPKEIAETLEVSENVVSVRLNRAMEKLRKKLNINE